MNSVILIGRLTKDPEIRQTTSGTNVTTFSLAVDRMFSKEKETDFIRIVVYGKAAESCARYLAKGKQAAVRGRIQTGSYETKDGEKRYTFDVIADQITFLSPKSDSAEQSVPDGFREYNEEDDEDVPF